MTQLFNSKLTILENEGYLSGFCPIVDAMNLRTHFGEIGLVTRGHDALFSVSCLGNWWEIVSKTAEKEVADCIYEVFCSMITRITS